MSAAVRIVVPVPSCLNAPLPEITPESVLLPESSSANVALSLILPVIEPLLVPSPSCKVPALIVVPPIGVGRGQDRGAGAELLECAATGDQSSEGKRVGTIDGERGIIGYVAGDRPCATSVAELQGAGADRGAAAIGVGRGQDRGAGAELLECAAAGDHARKRVAAGI